MTFSNERKGWWSKQRARGLSSEGTFYNSKKFDTDSVIEQNEKLVNEPNMSESLLSQVCAV